MQCISASALFVRNFRIISRRLPRKWLPPKVTRNHFYGKSVTKIRKIDCFKHIVYAEFSHLTTFIQYRLHVMKFPYLSQFQVMFIEKNSVENKCGSTGTWCYASAEELFRGNVWSYVILDDLFPSMSWNCVYFWNSVFVKNMFMIRGKISLPQSTIFLRKFR